MYRMAKAENSSLKMFSTSVLVEVKLKVHALMPKGAELGFVVNKMLVYHLSNHAIKCHVHLNEVHC